MKNYQKMLEDGVYSVDVIGKHGEFSLNGIGKNSKGHVIYRGKRPPSHDVLKQMGIKHRVDLQSGLYEKVFDDDLEKEDSKEFGITLHDFILSGITPPTIDQVHEILDVIDKADGPVYIHCLHGKDRTGFICACIYFESGFHFLDCVFNMVQMGFHWGLYGWWLFQLERCYREFKR